MNRATIDLIEWGRLSTLDEDASETLRQRVFPEDAINRMGRDWWRETCENLNDEQLECLIRGLTLAERDFKWSGGSVAGVIWIFGLLMDRTGPIINLGFSLSEQAESLAEWILKNSDNPYLPFGSHRGGATSVTGYYNGKKAKVERQRAIRINEQQAKIARLEENAELARDREKEGKERNRKRNDYLRKIEQKPLQERLEILVSDATRPVDFYPNGYASEVTEQLESLPKQLLIDLRKKLDRRNRKPWGKLNLRLQKVLQEVS